MRFIVRFWKTLALSWRSWPKRVVAEEQARLAAEGEL